MGKFTHRKMELGRVYYLTTTVEFPGDPDVYLRQAPIAGASTMAVYYFVNKLKIPKDQKKQLCEKLETHFRDEKGALIRMKIETTRRNDQNASKKVKFR